MTSKKNFEQQAETKKEGKKQTRREHCEQSKSQSNYKMIENVILSTLIVIRSNFREFNPLATIETDSSSLSLSLARSIAHSFMQVINLIMCS